jgi:hypothetical protein
MNLSKRAALCLALFVAMSLFSATAFGEPLGVRGYGVPYTDTLGITWTNSSHFVNSPLEGYVDWIVYGPGQFPYTDSGYVVPDGEYAYVYQVRNTGSEVISSFSFSVDQVVSGVSSFVSPNRVVGTGLDGITASPAKITWRLSDLEEDMTSIGLIFTSRKAPKTTSTGQIIDGGGSAGVVSLPVPGPNDIPEPGTLALMAAGLAFFAVRWRFSRR